MRERRIEPALALREQERLPIAMAYVLEITERSRQYGKAHAVRYAVHEGDRLPLTVGASSHVIRAFTGAAGARYEQIRRDMYSASYGERDPETAAVACPVFGTTQAFVGALTISGPKHRIESLGLERILTVMFKHAIDLTRILGGAIDDLARAMPKRKARKR